MSKAFATNAFDLHLLRAGERAKREWERSVSRGIKLDSAVMSNPPYVWANSPAGEWGAAFGESVAVRLAQRIVMTLPDLAFPRLAVRPRMIGRALIGGLLASTAVAATATVLALKGYVEHPSSFWQQRLSDRMHSPIFDVDHTLIGSVDTQGKLSTDQAANLAYIPLQGAVPSTFERGLLALENKYFYDETVRNVCGIDLLSLLRPIATFGRAGGSGISQQLTKELKQPDWGNEGNVATKAYRWAQQLGASCSLYRSLTATGGKSRIVHAYASYAPMWQGNGVLRGLAAASNVVFGVRPDELSNAQQLILAAAVKEPLRVAPIDAAKVDCASVYPRIGNLQFDAATANANRARANQCRVLYRAISMANQVLADQKLSQTLEELRAYQRDGIQPVNPFEPISAKKLVNLSTRTRAAMPSGLLAEIRREAEESTLPGEPLIVALDAVKQHEFAQAMNLSLIEIQSSAKARSLLCLPLVAAPTRMKSLRRCGIDSEKNVHADVLAIKADVATGGVKAMYASSPLILDSTQSIGSLAKWIVLVAALSEGYRADTLVCPRSAFDGARALVRVQSPVQGYANCENGKHAISFDQATARSDNLAYYDIAKRLGNVKLAAAAAALGFDELDDSINWAYELSFGTFGTRPRNLVTAAQALLSVAFEVRTIGAAPRVLTNVQAKGNESIQPLLVLLPTALHRQELRKLLKAPVDFERGTLGFVRGEIDAGKTGSTQSAVLDPTGRKYAHGKWSITYQAATGDINLLMIASPLPSVPLAHHSIGGTVLAPALRTLLFANQE